MKYSFTSIFLLSAITLSCAQPKPKAKEMVEVQGGTLMVGNSAKAWNLPRQVTLDSFLMAKYPVTVGEWKVFLEETGLSFNWDWIDPVMERPFRELVPDDACPAQGLNWYSAIAYCNWLSEREGLEPCYMVEGEIRNWEIEPAIVPEVTWNKGAKGYRLPTDAEWEYAARGGQESKGFLYAGSDDPDEVALYQQEASYPVGQMKPNELGLYDMTGNVQAWCWDWFDYNPGAWQPEKNPSVDAQSDVRQLDRGNPQPMKVIRGFDWQFTPLEIYSRDHFPPVNTYWIGIRLVRSL